MGKTAIAQMVALAQLTAGWEAHVAGNQRAGRWH
jgi:hypothetical protein